jgi:DNA-directed RNA polymerase specialized sigma24 family protein
MLGDTRKEEWARIFEEVKKEILSDYRARFERAGGDVDDAYQSIINRSIAKETDGEVQWTDPSTKWKDPVHMIKSFRRALINELKNQHKRSKRAPDGDMEVAERTVEDTQLPGPDVMLDRSQRNDIMREAISRLTPKEQELVSAVIDSDTIGEAAALLNVPEDVAYKRWQRVLEQFIQMNPEALLGRRRRRLTDKEEN